ncbi:CPCC family cysteine-rich protein [Brevundimonas sp.]|uniref:CPCC family cysteine-rich protein n=1 Tax=Brevundimonas sp. TaxID=1871086 RepID=UPI003515E26C
MSEAGLLACPCCGWKVFSEPCGSYDICPICFWEDDPVQLADPTLAGGANDHSLIKAQETFIQHGVSEIRFLRNVRSPCATDARDPLWRAFDPIRDQVRSLRDGPLVTYWKDI